MTPEEVGLIRELLRDGQFSTATGNTCTVCGKQFGAHVPGCCVGRATEILECFETELK